MDLLIFWLTPVILAVVLIFVAISHRPKDKAPTMNLIEPLGLLLKDWQLARTIGSEGRLRELINYFAATELDHWSRLGEIIKSTDRRQPKVALTKSQLLPLLGERREMTVDNKTVSIVIGLPTEIIGQIEAVDPKHAAEAARAETNGLLALHVGELIVHGETSQATHRYVGTLLYEPKFQPPAKLATLQNPRWLSVLPPALLAHYFQGEQADGHAYAASEITQAGPQEAEERLAAARVIGSANLRDRYQILGQYQRHSICQLWSSNPEDKKLPLTTHQF